VASKQNTFAIEIDEKNNSSDNLNNSYKITGGGQLIEASEKSAAIFQQAMIDLVVSNSCKKIQFLVTH